MVMYITLQQRFSNNVAISHTFLKMVYSVYYRATIKEAVGYRNVKSKWLVDKNVTAI